MPTGGVLKSSICGHFDGNKAATKNTGRKFTHVLPELSIRRPIGGFLEWGYP